MIAGADDETADDESAVSEAAVSEAAVSEAAVSEAAVSEAQRDPEPAAGSDASTEDGGRVSEEAAAPASSPPATAPEPAPVLEGPPAARLAQLGISLPPAPASVAAYVPALRSGDLVFTSGQLPFIDGALPLTGVVGELAVDVTPDEATSLARQCAVNALAAIAGVVDLDDVERVVKVVVYVASAPGYAGQPQVADGASRLFEQVFAEAGRHVRSAVGVSALPLRSPVEVEVVVQVARSS